MASSVDVDDKKLDGLGLGSFWGIVKTLLTSNVFPVSSSHIAPNGT